MNYCRICLCKEPSRDLFLLQDDAILNRNGDKQSCEEIMLFCLSIEIAQDEKRSTKLCEVCYTKIIEFYKFKVLALKNDAHFKSIDSKTIVSIEFLKNAIKTEEPIAQFSEEDNHNDQEDEPMIYAEDIKEECKQENVSDDELINTFRNEFQASEKVPIKTANAQTKKKRGRRRGRPKKVQDNGVKKSKAGPIKICDHCGKEVRGLRQHMRQHEPPKDEKPFECDMCGKRFRTKVTVRKHIMRHFPTKHKCPICGKIVSGLKMHMQVMHNTENLQFECMVCHYRFLTKCRLANHMTIHTKDRPFQCEICLQNYRTKVTLSMHIRQVHNKERSHLCQFCSKRFFKKHHLQEHLKSHTHEKPYKCDQCGKCMGSSKALKNHLLVHGGVKKYACTLCDMAFTVHNYLQAHMKSHIRDKKYQCRFCDMRYHRSDHRKRHEYTAHKQLTTASTPVAVL